MPRQNPFGEKYKKYWDLMDKKFSKFDEGVQTDLEGLYSTGPEEISKKIARKTGVKTVVDGFCGVGGSTIGFAHYADKVYAVDNNHERLEMAKHNVGIYGFSEKVEFIEGDFLVKAPKLKAEAVFIDPPWGGPDYIALETFTLGHFSPHGKDLLRVGFNNFDKVVLRVPRNFNLKELDDLNKFYVVDDEIFENHIIFKTVYFFKPESK